jgi:hypothetical protein
VSAGSVCIGGKTSISAEQHQGDEEGTKKRFHGESLLFFLFKIYALGGAFQGF